MKPIRVPVVLALALVLAACGSASHMQTLDGVWNAQLSNSDGTSASAFQTVLTQAGGADVNVTGFVFTVPDSCFSSETSQHASFTPAAGSRGTLMGEFEMTVTTLFPQGNNVLTLQGTVNGTAMTGTWSLTGGTGPCNGSGDFQMDKLPAL